MGSCSYICTQITFQLTDRHLLLRKLSKSVDCSKVMDIKNCSKMSVNAWWSHYSETLYVAHLPHSKKVVLKSNLACLCGQTAGPLMVWWIMILCLDNVYSQRLMSSRNALTTQQVLCFEMQYIYSLILLHKYSGLIFISYSFRDLLMCLMSVYCPSSIGA